MSGPPRTDQVVCFDGDGTLWDFEAAMRSALTATLDLVRTRRPGAATEGLSVATMVDDLEAVKAELGGPGSDGTNLAVIRRAAFGRTLARLDLADDALRDELHEHYMAARRERVRAYTDVRPVLERLSRTHRLALLSNGNTDPAYAGLDDLLDVVVFAQDIGVGKPDPRSYAELERRCRAERVVMVGDSLDDDVAGAQRAGWTALWLNRTGARCPATVRPDGVLTSLAELPTLLGQDTR